MASYLIIKHGHNFTFTFTFLHMLLQLDFPVQPSRIEDPHDLVQFRISFWNYGF
jgi:hypothetical protein